MIRAIDDDRGATTTELAFVLPVLILMIYCIYILGTIFQANAGMQHALGEGARLATLYPTPDNVAIKARIDAKFFSSPGGFFRSTVIDGADNLGGCNTPAGSSFKTLRVTYSMPVNLLFFRLPDLSLARCKIVYTSA